MAAKEETNDDSVIWMIGYKHRRKVVPVGITGIHDIRPTHRHATTGTFIGDKAFWRCGIATVAMLLRTKFAFEMMNLHKLNSSLLDGNVGSLKAQEAAGYRVIGRRKEEFWSNGQWVDEILTEVLAADWFAASKSIDK